MRTKQAGKRSPWRYAVVFACGIVLSLACVSCGKAQAPKQNAASNEPPPAVASQPVEPPTATIGTEAPKPLPAGVIASYAVSDLKRTHPDVIMENGGLAIRATATKGYLCYGQYAKNLPNKPLDVYFGIGIDNNTADNLGIISIDVYDSDSKVILAQGTVYRRQFKRTAEATQFKLAFTPSAASVLEFRIYYLGNAYVFADKIVVVDPSGMVKGGVDLAGISIDWVVDVDPPPFTDRAGERKPAPLDAKPFGGHWYRAFYPKAHLSWYVARDMCESMGGYLASIESAEENTFVKSMLNGHVVYWLGATDEVKVGSWVWANGGFVTYANWAKGQPDNTNGAEHYMAAGWDGQWHDNLVVHGAEAYVCEWETCPDKAQTSLITTKFAGPWKRMHPAGNSTTTLNIETTGICSVSESSDIWAVIKEADDWLTVAFSNGTYDRFDVSKLDNDKLVGEQYPSRTPVQYSRPSASDLAQGSVTGDQQAPAWDSNLPAADKIHYVHNNTPIKDDDGTVLNVPIQQVTAYARKAEWYAVWYRTLNNAGWTSWKKGVVSAKNFVTEQQYYEELKAIKAARRQREEAANAAQRQREEAANAAEHTASNTSPVNKAVNTAYFDQANKNLQQKAKYEQEQVNKAVKGEISIDQARRNIFMNPY